MYFDLIFLVISESYELFERIRHALIIDVLFEVPNLATISVDSILILNPQCPNLGSE